jgi:Tfp pilus assembly protein PilV
VTRPRLHRRGWGRLHTTGGFTLVELTVAMLVIAIVLLALVTLQVRALESVGLSKQRQQATALGNRTMEQLRALPYDTVTAGLNVSDVTDSNIATVGGVLTFKPAYDSSISEVLKTSSGQTQPPLYRHTQDASTPLTPTKIGNVQYRVRSYVTVAPQTTASTDAGYFLTVLVDWSSGVTKGLPKTIAVRSQVFSPSGCALSSTATRPFAGPCQPFFYADAGTTPAGITVTPVTADAELVTGTGVRALSATMPTLSTRTQTEQVVSAQSVVTTSVAKVTGVTDGGGQSATSAADTDPVTGAGNSPAAAAAVAYSGSSTLTSSGGANGSFSATVPPAGSGSTYSTTAAGAAGAPPCADDAVAAFSTGEVCSTGNIAPTGDSYAASMNLSLAGRNLGTTSLATMAPGGAYPTWRAFGARALLPVMGHCPGTNALGCVTAGIRRSMGATSVGGLPPASPSDGDTLPTGFTSMVTLNGFSAIASAESGVASGRGVATATRGANNLTYWDGTGYGTMTLSSAAATQTLGTATGIYRIAGQPLLEVTMSGTVTVEPVTPLVGTVSQPCQAAACTATSTVGAVQVAVDYAITNAGVPLGAFTVTANLGSSVAKTTYKAAPSV